MEPTIKIGYSIVLPLIWASLHTSSTMAPSPLEHRRTQNLLLFQRLLGLRDGSSPFTLVLDGLEMKGTSLVGEIVTRVKMARTKVIFVSFQTMRKPKSVDVFIRARCGMLDALRQEIVNHITVPEVGEEGKGGSKFCHGDFRQVFRD